MSETILATVNSIKKAMKKGCRLGYNHSIKEINEMDRLIEDHFKEMIMTVKNEKARLNIMKKKIKNPRTIMLPITLALVHKHRMGIECEDHARVFLTTMPGRIFDIPMTDWINMKLYYDEIINRNNLI